MATTLLSAHCKVTAQQVARRIPLASQSCILSDPEHPTFSGKELLAQNRKTSSPQSPPQLSFRMVSVRDIHCCYSIQGIFR